VRDSGIPRNQNLIVRPQYEAHTNQLLVFFFFFVFLLAMMVFLGV
jgi:hypothetical protein